MAISLPHRAESASVPGYPVEAAGECDAIGVALRDAFEREMGIPEDTLALLRRISAPPVTTRDF